MSSQDETPALTLQRAAELVRSRAAAATVGSYNHDRYFHGGGRLSVIEPDISPTRSGRRELIADFYQEGDREWYPLFTPGIADPLAALLDREAKVVNRRHPSDPNPALELARVLLGEVGS